MKRTVKNLVLAAMFLAIGLVLPFITGNIPAIGQMLLPMHFPVLLCGLICGWQYGLLVGLICPLLRSVAFGMPVLYPVAIEMMAELATYGAVAGLVYSHLRPQNIGKVYIALIVAMLAGRVVYGVVAGLLLGFGTGFTMSMFISAAFVNALPGIIAQLVLIPVIMAALNKAKLVPYRK